jgi:hypothetical protein
MDGGSRGGSNPGEVGRPAEKPIPMVARRVVLWRRLDEPAFDHCRLVEFAEGYALEGTVLTVLDGQPARIHYGVFCGHDWLTRHAHAAVVQGTVARQIQFRRDEENRWWRDDVHVPALDGVLDIDLSITPATNTLPLRRLTLGVGASEDTDAAWVRFPELSLERLPQRYTRESDRHYRYESGGGAFKARLEVDSEGVVVRYGDLWERIAAGPENGRP